MKNHRMLSVLLTIGLLVSSAGTVVASEGIPGTSQAVPLAAGLNHTCAVSNGNVFCWGDNFIGQLGTGDNTSSNVPREVVEQIGSSNPLSGVLSVSAGWQHTCALMQTGNVKCWGYNYNGELGDPTYTYNSSNVPIDVAGLTSVSSISLGWNYSCALTTAGSVKCWGANGFGKLGDGNTTDSSTPVNVVGLAGPAIAVAAGQVHTCALLASGAVQCWGYNYFGQLGNGTTLNSLAPVFVSGVLNAVAIASGFHHTCAALADGSAVCWGRNNYGQLGNSNNSTGISPVPVPVLATNLAPLGNIATVSAGFSHSCARSLTGGVFCWGADFYDQLGDGIYTNSSTAVQVVGIDHGYYALTSGQHHSCAMNNPKGIKCWGYNYNGQLGDGYNQTSDTPVTVFGFDYVPPANAIQNLINNVLPGLVQNGYINDGQETALISKLQAALKQLAHGNQNAAVNLLSAFINQVQALVNSGSLTPAEGQSLIDSATRIINSITG